MSTRSKVEKFIDALRNRILSGEFGNTGRLPSFRTLATEYNTTQETMNKTMQALQAEGLITSLGAKGVFANTPSTRLLGFTPNFLNIYKVNMIMQLKKISKSQK
jgi:DNA-binding GntR family transcriptional regulator